MAYIFIYLYLLQANSYLNPLIFQPLMQASSTGYSLHVYPDLPDPSLCTLNTRNVKICHRPIRTASSQPLLHCKGESLCQNDSF